METMLFADEVVPPDAFDELSDGKAKTTKKEVEMARQLVDSLSGDFEPEKYHDEYRERVLEMIERKAQGEEIVIEAPPEEPEEVPDLMAALEASIAATKKQSDGGEKKKAAPRKKAASSKRRRRASPAHAPRRSPSASPCRRHGSTVEVEGRRLSLSNLDKVMYPETGFTKGQVIDYYTRVAPALLPHLRGRPLTLKRYPDGVDGEHFYEKQCPSHRPDWVATAAIPVSRKTIDFCLCDDLPTLVWLANLADLELHPSLSLAKAVERPTAMAFDLDPGPPAALDECREVALLLREALAGTRASSASPRPPARRGCRSTSRWARDVTYDDTKPLSHAIARHLEKASPGADRLAPEEGAPQGQGADRLEPERRAQDDRRRLLAPRPAAPDRLDPADVGRGRATARELVFEAPDVLERVERHGDLFAPLAGARAAAAGTLTE